MEFFTNGKYNPNPIHQLRVDVRNTDPVDLVFQIDVQDGVISHQQVYPYKIKGVRLNSQSHEVKWDDDLGYVIAWRLLFASSQQVAMQLASCLAGNLLPSSKSGYWILQGLQQLM